MKNRLRFLLIVALVTVVAGTTVGCGGRGGKADGPGGEEQGADGAESEGDETKRAAPVEVAVLARGPIEATLKFSADLEAEVAVPVFSQAARRVIRLLVEEGDEVERGDLLITLEDDEQRNALAKVESQVQKARRDWERQKSLFERELVAEEVFTQATYDLEQLEIGLDDTERELSYTEVRAPIRGTITGRTISVGDYVTLNQQLFDMVDFDSLVVRVYVPERDLARIAVGQPVRLASQAAVGRVFGGTVDRIAPVVDSRTGTVKSTIMVPYREGLLPGMFLQVEIVTAVRDDALLVPKRALILDDDQSFVFRVSDDDTVERLPVVAVLQDAASVEVAKGLAIGDRVVVAGQAGLKPGDSVRVVARPGEMVAEVEAQGSGGTVADEEAVDEAADD